MFIFNKKIYFCFSIIAMLMYVTVNAQSTINNSNNSSNNLINPNLDNKQNTVSSDEFKINLSKNYINKDNKFSIKYPENWIFENSEKNSVTFSGKINTPSYFSTINIQAVASKKLGGIYGSVKDVIADIKTQVLKESPKTTFLNAGSYVLTTTKGFKLNGEFLIFIYSYESHIIEQWQIVIPHKDGLGFYTWAYTSPLSQYNKDLAIAKAMLSTWTIMGN